MFKPFHLAQLLSVAALLFSPIAGRTQLPCQSNPLSIVCDNFDSYTAAAALGPQSDNWTTWSGNEGTDEDGLVTDEQAFSAPNSLKISSDNPLGGPQDVVLDLKNQLGGRYEIQWKMFVPTGKEGYFNIQNAVPVGTGDWNLEAYFKNNGCGHIEIAGVDTIPQFTFLPETWFTVRQVIDLEFNLLTLYIDSNAVAKLRFHKNLGGINFFGSNELALFYIDDVEYIALPPSNPDQCDQPIDIAGLFWGPTDDPQVSGLQDNTLMTPAASDPTITCWNEHLFNPGFITDTVNHSLWYAFKGTGFSYHITTVPCNATQYIGGTTDPGDTQLALFTGDCGFLQLAGCSDDEIGNPNDPNWIDWRAGLDFQTESGVDYRLMLDGFQAGNFIATGEFCLQVTKLPTLTCMEAQMGTFSVDNNGFICQNDNIKPYISLQNNFVLPNEGPVSGLAWVVTSQAVPNHTWPPTMGSAYFGSTQILPFVFEVSIPNDSTILPYGTYWLTPVIVGGAVDTLPTNNATFIGDTDPTDGCFITGQSAKIQFLPKLQPIELSASTELETYPPGYNGSIDLTVNGGLAPYLGEAGFTYQWSNGAQSADLNDLSAGTYTVTVQDISGCTPPEILVVPLENATQSTAPEVGAPLAVFPNPTFGIFTINARMESALDLTLTIYNAFGQPVKTLILGKTDHLLQSLDLSDYPPGLYSLQLFANGKFHQKTTILVQQRY